MSRQLRRVPANWKHPKFYRKNFFFEEEYNVELVYRPLSQYDYKEDVKDYKKNLKDWLKGQKKWNKGIYWDDLDGTEKSKKVMFRKWLENIEEDRKKHGFKDDYRYDEKIKYITGICTWEDVAGKIPSMPDPDDYMPDGDWYQLYETVSEGTPLSPPFKTTEELINWLSNNVDYWGNSWTRKQAEGIVKKGFVFSMGIMEGKLLNSQELAEQ